MSDESHLLRSQQADVARAIGESGLDGADFDWRDVDGGWAGLGHVPALVHLPTGFVFAFAQHIEISEFSDRTFHTDRHDVMYQPGAQSQSKTERNLPWENVLGHVRAWLSFVERELGAPEFREILEGLTSAGRSQAPPAKDDAPFSAEERDQIASQIDQLLDRIVRLEDLQEKEAAFVEAEFEELKAELNRMNRGKWRKFVAGTLVHVALSQVLEIGIVGEIWQTLGGESALLLPPE